MAPERPRLRIDRSRCKDCLLCAEVCPHGVLSVSKDVNERGVHYVELARPEKCTGCGMCVTICPDCAIGIVAGEQRE